MCTEIKIFSTNDIHGRFLEENDAIDFSKLATLRKNTPNSLLIDAGDATQGTPLAISKMGQYPIEIMNEVGYDILTVGNHEFDNITKDEGKDCELDIIIDKFKGTYLAANLFKEDQNYIACVKKDSSEGKGIYEIRTVNGKNLLFIGITTPDISMGIKRMDGFKINGIEEFSKQIENIISDQRKSKKVDAVIIVSHLGIAKNTTTSEMLANKVSGIDLIIDGHSHDECTKKVSNGTYIVQTGCYGKKFAEITLKFSNDKKLTVSAELHDKNYLKDYKQDSKVHNMLEEIKGNLDNTFGRVWAKCSICTLWGGALEEEKPYILKAVNIARYAETNMGQIVSEAMIQNTIIKLNETSENYKNKYIVASINGGGLRDSIAFDKEIRNYELFSVIPSPLDSANESGYKVYEIKLKCLKNILLNSVSALVYENGKLSCSVGKFLNVAGISFNVVYDENEENKISISDKITLNRMMDYSNVSKTFSLNSDKDESILFCTPKYIANGGDGYTTFVKKTPVLSVNTALYQITGEYIYRTTEGYTLMADCVSKNISYSGFKFNKPSDYNILLTDINSVPLKNVVVMVRFNKEDEKNDVCRFLVSDNKGFITVKPPEGNSILEIVILNSINPKIKLDNLYCELYFHTYYMQEKNKLTACCTEYKKKPYILKKLTTFCHEKVSTEVTHYSNFLNYIDHDYNLCSLIIYDNQFYVLHRNKNEYEYVREKENCIKYIDNDGSKKTFSLSLNYKTWDGVKYIGLIV